MPVLVASVVHDRNRAVPKSETIASIQVEKRMLWDFRSRCRDHCKHSSGEEDVVGLQIIVHNVVVVEMGHIVCNVLGPVYTLCQCHSKPNLLV